MELEFVLRYFAVRGRCEPIIMVLEDAGLPYSLEETTVEEWVNRKASGNVHPEDVPFGRLPTLEVYPRKDHRTAATKPQFVIGETGSILRFLDNYNSRRNRPDEPVNMVR
jgi:glutathione S-transferase